ncbi:MAG TPA: flagellar biosynthetic protein FliR [Kofleriaceae bacterium]|nr:flagellar biosynthetic protein FliR [Kofleriaceae bacterium]
MSTMSTMSTTPATLVLALRGAAAVVVLVALVGGIPRIVQVGLAVAVGVWSAALAGAPVPEQALWLVAGRELAIGATIGLVAALPLVMVVTAGRLVDRAAGARVRGPYGTLFGILSAAVFVGIDGHVVFLTEIATSFRDVPAVAVAEPRVLALLAGLLPIAGRLAMPWLVTAAVVEIAMGVAVRLAGRAAIHGPMAAATPAALVMMTASLMGTLAVAITGVVRWAW